MSGELRCSVCRDRVTHLMSCSPLSRHDSTRHCCCCYQTSTAQWARNTELNKRWNLWCNTSRCASLHYTWPARLWGAPVSPLNNLTSPHCRVLCKIWRAGARVERVWDYKSGVTLSAVTHCTVHTGHWSSDNLIKIYLGPATHLHSYSGSALHCCTATLATLITDNKMQMVSQSPARNNGLVWPPPHPRE